MYVMNAIRFFHDKKALIEAVYLLKGINLYN